MYTLADQFQFQAWAIQQGRHQLAARHLEIMSWISQKFGITALDFFCERRGTSNDSFQQLVHVILLTGDDVKKVKLNSEGQQAIRDRFLAYFKTTELSSIDDALKCDVFPTNTDPFPEILVTYRPLKELDSKIVEELWKNDERKALKAFEQVWTISQTIVFYYNDEQIKENQANGTSEKISNMLASISIKYGVTNKPAFTFDSKESFDRDYESNWYYYWK